MRENAFCCGAGRGTREAFPDFASWAAEQRLVEVTAVALKLSSQPVPGARTISPKPLAMTGRLEGTRLCGSCALSSRKQGLKEASDGYI